MKKLKNRGDAVEKPYLLKLDLKQCFPGGAIPNYIEATRRHMTELQIRYDKAVTELNMIFGSDKLTKIIEAESGDYNRRMAFIETTRQEILNGACYSKCETIDDMAEVYSESLLRRLGF